MKDHYSTVCQIAGYFSILGIEFEIQHYDGVDIVAKLPDKKTLAIEYERPNSHTVTQVFEKFKRAEKEYDSCIVVYTTQNKKEIKEAVGHHAAIPKGHKTEGIY